LKKKKNKSPEKPVSTPIPKLGQLKESKSSAKLRTTMTRTNLRSSKNSDDGDKTQSRKGPAMQRVKSWRFGAKGTGVKTAKDEQKVIESMIDDIIDSLAPTK